MPNQLPPVNATRYGAVSQPELVLTFAGKRTGDALSIKSLTHPAILVPVAERRNGFVQIETFTLLLITPRGSFTQTCTGNTVPAEAMNRISSAPAGSLLRFKEVVCKTGNSKQQKLEAEFTLTL